LTFFPYHIISSVLKHTKILLFADEAKIFKTIHSVSDALELQSDLDVFSDWCTKNGMELNINKCSIISFSLKKKTCWTLITNF